MTEVIQKKAAFKQEKLILEGIVRFNNVKKPVTEIKDKNGKVTTIEPRFDLTLAVAEDSATVLKMEEVTALAIKHERSQLPAAKQRSIGENVLLLSQDILKDGTETGLVKMQLKRKAKYGPPVIKDAQNVVVDMPFIPSGSEVRVMVTAYSYNVGGKVGLATSLEGIQIVKEAERGVFVPKMAEAEFEPLNLSESPF